MAEMARRIFLQALPHMPHEAGGLDALNGHRCAGTGLPASRSSHPALRWAEASAVRAFVICAALPRQCRGRVARRALFSLLQGRAAL